MNYKQTLDYIFSQLPMYQRIGAAAYKADLHNTFALCRLSGNPHDKFRSIHIAGTNGKGSVSHILASILQKSGLKTGLHTSPHYKDFRERIKINGEMIPAKEVCGFIKKYKSDFDKLKPSFFEMSVAMAFDYFARQNVDVAVVETGMGGRLDSTNILTPMLSVITNIAIDHSYFLGATPQKIAGEKAGIIKPGVPVVIGETQETVKDIFIKKAKEQEAQIFFADENKFEEYETDLTGNFQRKNITTAMMCLKVLNIKSLIKITENNIRNGLKNVRKDTGFLGRWQIISKTPLTICDSAHNQEGIREAVQQINETPHNMLHFVFGMVNDKDIDSVLSLLPKNAVYYFCKADIPRGMDSGLLKAKAESFGLNGNNYTDVKKAFISAQKNAKNGDIIYVGGSIFVAGEIL